MNTRQASAASNPLLPIPTMAYAQQHTTYANHPVPVGPPGGMYTVGGMLAGPQGPQYQMLTGPQSATAGHGGPLGSGPGVPVGGGRGAMPMAVNGQPQGPGTSMPMRYGPSQMGVGRAMNGMVQTAPGRGIGMPGTVGGMTGMRVLYQPGMNPPPGARIMAAQGGMPGHPGQQYLVNVNQHGQAVSFAPMSQSQQQHTNPNGPGQSSAHMLIPQPQPGGPPQQPPPLGGPGMTHSGGPGQKLYQQQQPFMGGMTSGPIGALPPPNGGSPVRNPSPSAATPANAPTPGGPGAVRGMTNPTTPANGQPFGPTNAPTPGGRPGTASGPQNTAIYTPRMTAAEMAGAGVGVQSSPGAMQRNTSTNMGLQQQQQLQGQQGQQAHLSQSGGPGSQSVGPGGPGGPMDHSSLFRPTPAQIEIDRTMRIYGPSQNQGLMEGVRYTMGPNPGQAAQEQQRQRQMTNPPQPGPLQPQHTGGSLSSHQGPLAPQHTGGARPLAPQHTGGSMQDSAMNGPGGTAIVPGRTSVPSTPQLASRQASMSMGGGPAGMMPMGTMPGMPAMQGYPMGAGMAPPPPRNEGVRSFPMELVNATTMGSDGMMGIGSSRHAFGVLRLLQFSSQMRQLSGYDAEKWSSIIAENFTENATLSFRAQKETRQPTNTFGMLVKLPFPLLCRFFATLTQSNINRMSLILDGAIESQDGQEYTVYCPTARWPMYYDGGYILELNGVLKARCKTVPVTLLGADAGKPAGAPSSTPRMSSAASANPNTNGFGSSPSSSSNMHASPTNKASTTGNVPNGSEIKAFIPTPNVPYMVKIDELFFDSGSVNKLIDFGSMTSNHLPREPENVFGVPRLTMRMIEFSEGAQALEPLIDYESTQTMGVLSALNVVAAQYEQNRVQGQIVPPRESPDEYAYANFGGRWMKPQDVMAPVNEVIHSGKPMKGPISFDDPNSSGSPSTLSANVNQRISDPIEPSSNSASEPTVSPLLAPKTPGKKTAPPGSPTKATANGTTDKDKGSGKRKNTNDVEGPPSKRRTTRKGSKAN